MIRISIKNKIWLTLFIIICVFITLINTIIGYQIKDINTQEILNNMKASALAYQRYSEQRQSLLLSNSESIANTPYLKATLSIQDLDTETLAYTMSNIKVADDISLLLILDTNAALKFDMERPDLDRIGLEAMPGITNIFNGENYFGYWHYQEEYYRVAISPSIAQNQLLGIVVLGQKLTELSQLSVIEDVSSAHALMRYEDDFYSIAEQSDLFNRSLQQHAYPISKLVIEKSDTVKFSEVTFLPSSSKLGTFYAISLPFDEGKAELILYKEQTSLLARLNQVQQIILTVSLFTLIFGIVISWLISLRISQPLSQIMTMVKKYSDGDFSAKITKIPKDELGDLALAFNLMGDHIIESRKNLLDRKVAEDKMRQLAYIDELTGLPNRRNFMAKLDELLVRSNDKQTEFAVIFIDIDNFKFINDSLGHEVGDELLKQFSVRLENSFRTHDTLAYTGDEFKHSNVSRLGGDEFIILLKDIAGKDDVIMIANRITRAFVEPFVLDKKEVNVTGSLGVSMYPEDGTSSTKLLKYADIAMYSAKKQGKNAFMLYSPKMNEDTIDRLNLESDIRKAFINNEFIVYYQPVINITTNKIVGAEALVRWKHPVNGLMFPDSFISIIEKLGFIDQLGEYVLRQSCQSFLKWKRKGFPLSNIAVNFSVLQFNQSNAYHKVKLILDELEFPPEYLTLEITETVLMNIETNVINTLEKLRDKGITISLDDFGTGYSSLKYLSVLPIDILKIDKSFTSDITIEGDSKGIVTAIIAMAKSLSLEIIAEGVEVPEQLNFLSENKVDFAQGFYFSQAISVDEFEELLLSTEFEFFEIKKITP